MNENQTAQMMETLVSISDFLGSEIPAFAKEYIMWGLVKNGVGTVVCSIVVIGGILHIKRNAEKIGKIFDDKIPSFLKVARYGCLFIAVGACFMMLFIYAPDLAKIIIAPRAYLFDEIIK